MNLLVVQAEKVAVLHWLAALVQLFVFLILPFGVLNRLADEQVLPVWLRLRVLPVPVLKPDVYPLVPFGIVHLSLVVLSLPVQLFGVLVLLFDALIPLEQLILFGVLLRQQPAWLFLPVQLEVLNQHIPHYKMDKI